MFCRYTLIIHYKEGQWSTRCVAVTRQFEGAANRETEPASKPRLISCLQSVSSLRLEQWKTYPLSMANLPSVAQPGHIQSRLAEGAHPDCSQIYRD